MCQGYPEERRYTMFQHWVERIYSPLKNTPGYLRKHVPYDQPITVGGSADCCQGPLCQVYKKLQSDGDTNVIEWHITMHDVESHWGDILFWSICTNLRHVLFYEPAIISVWFIKAVMLDILQKQPNNVTWCKLFGVVNRGGGGRDKYGGNSCTAEDITLMMDSISKQRMFDGETVQASQLFSWQSRFLTRESQIANMQTTYPSLYEDASWRADARMSISMRLSCKVSRKDCFAMFLHTDGKMEVKRVWDVRARNIEVPIQCVISKQQQLTNGNQDRQGDTHKLRPLWNYFYKGVRQTTSSFLHPLIWALPYLVLYEPCPSLQASCSSLINISVFWLLVVVIRRKQCITCK